MTLEISHDSDNDRWTIIVPVDRDLTTLAVAVDDAATRVASEGGGLAHLWVHAVDPVADDIVTIAGFSPHRDLWQLRCPLPAERSPLKTRAFTEADTDALIRVNNRAFSWHPEQSGMSRASLAATMAESWYDPQGFRLYERDGELVGFCWTKIHADERPVLGEIFVIAVDPSAHGQGLGSPMTRAGLDWLSDRGIEHGMLYVESDNDPANRTYERIGFVHHRTDRAYNRTIEPSIS